MAKVKRMLPTRSNDNPLEERLRSSMMRTFSKADKSNLDNALHLAGQKKLATATTEDDIIAVAKRTQNSAIALRQFSKLYQTQDKSSLDQLFRAALGMTTISCAGSGLNTVEDVSVPIVLAAHFMNRIIQDPEGIVRRLADLDADPVKKIVRLYLAWWSSIDVAAIQKSLVPKSESSAARVTFCIDPMMRGLPVEEKTTYHIKRNGCLCGHVSWDKGIGPARANGHGWVVTLYDGFNESGFRTGRCSKNPNEPFTAVHGGEIKLQNPTRLPFNLAKQWARQALKH